MIAWCPSYDEHGIRLSRMLTDRGTEFCLGDSHEYELHLAVEDIDHTRNKAKSPQTNGICERFHYRVALGKKIYRSIDELQADLDAWIAECNWQRPHGAAGASERLPSMGSTGAFSANASAPRWGPVT